jgi:3-phosphoshikimate 1-carboxyvinyltransferase
MKDGLLLVNPPGDKTLHGTVYLPSSKSISNRVLIIRELCREPFRIDNLSEADDTKTLQQALNSLKSTDGVIDVGHAGTAMRFLTAYLATSYGRFVLTGSDRMKVRPIGALVDALLTLGSTVEYIGEPGYPPVMITGKKLKGGKINIDAGTSSQFISALLMIAPLFDDGLQLTLTGKAVSTSYIRMTLNLMAYFGIEYQWEGSLICIRPGQYRSRAIRIEPDWSGASYFYAALLLSKDGGIYFPELTPSGLQGDENLCKWFEELGITTRFEREGVYASKTGQPPDFLTVNFTDNPDLAQTIALAFAGAKIQAEFRGLETLPLKETDRIAALQTELKKLGFLLNYSGKGAWHLKMTQPWSRQASLCFDTYNDHRMAMSCAPLALKYGQIAIRNPEVVIKSFPAYWENLGRVGFKTEELNP